jgi:hypothetical protein
MSPGAARERSNRLWSDDAFFSVYVSGDQSSFYQPSVPGVGEIHEGILHHYLAIAVADNENPVLVFVKVQGSFLVFIAYQEGNLDANPAPFG